MSMTLAIQFLWHANIFIDISTLLNVASKRKIKNVGIGEKNVASKRKIKIIGLGEESAFSLYQTYRVSNKKLLMWTRYSKFYLLI